MPRVTQSPIQQRFSNPKSGSSKVLSSQQQHYPQNQQNYLQGEHQHQTPYAPLPSNKKVQSKNNSSNHLQSKRAPKYEQSNGSSNKNLNSQGNKISRVRQELIDMKGQKHSRSKEKLSNIKQVSPSGQIPSKQVGKLSSQIRNNHQKIKEEEEINTPQQRKIRDLHNNMQKLSESLVDLRENYDRLQKEEIKYSNNKNINRLQQSRVSKLENISKNRHQSLLQKNSLSPQESASQNTQQMLSKSKAPPKTNEEILQFLLEKQRQKQQRKKKLSVITQKSKKKIEEQLLQRQKQEQQYLKWRKEQIRNAHNFEEKHKLEKEVQQNRRKAEQEYSKQIKDKKYKYLVKNMQFQENKQKQFQQNRQKVVGQRKQMNKPLNLGQFDQHEKWFSAKREELIEQRRLLRQDEIQKIQQENSNLPQFWRGQAHQIAQDQRKRVKEKLKQPLIKAQKVKQYKQYLHENFKPKSPKLVKYEPKANFDPNKYREIKRYRYYKGVSYGEIAQTAPMAKDAKQIKRIGDSNMEIMKKIPKKRNQNSSLLVNSFTPQPQRKFDINLVRNIFSSVVQKEKEKVLKVSLPQNLKCDELGAMVDKVRSKSLMLYDRQKFLDREGNKNGKNRIQQQKLVDGLVENIELKLNLLSQL